MPKLTVIEGSASTEKAQIVSKTAAQDPAEALRVLKDYLNIGDPAIQHAIADLIAALARISH